MLIWQMNLRHLQAVVRIAELGRMSAAAQAVNLTQPAITQALARLEALLATQLFERGHDGMVPTVAAELFVPRIRAALDYLASPHVTTSRMRALLALADSGSYNGASLLTGLSQPSLHRSVNDLSLSLRRTLVVRRGKAVALTDAGRAQARTFRLARLELEAGLTELDALKGIETRSIIVGAMPLSRARVLPAAIARFNCSRPKVRVAIIEGSRAELIEPLRNGAIDLTIGALRDPLIELDLDQEPLFSDLPVILARKGHPLEGRRPALEELAAYPWIVAAPGAPLRESWDRMFLSAGRDPPEVQIESGSVMIIRQLLIQGDFLTLLSPDQVAVELEAEWLVALRSVPEAMQRTIGITTRRSWRPTEVQCEFVAHLHAVCAKSG